MKDPAQIISEGKAFLGIELGSTRIKAVLIDSESHTLCSGSHKWENRLENGVWTYHLEDVWAGIQDAYAKVAAKVRQQYGCSLTQLAGIGFSAMMHGYLAFDKDGRQLAEFRTWRNTMTEPAARELTELFHFNIPQRWSIAHLYQAILNEEAHVADIATLTTLAGYVHWQLTGRSVLGVGEASGMFPIDSDTGLYDELMMKKFADLIADKHYSWSLKDILPAVASAGEDAGCLTEAGAKLLDPSGALQPGTPLCPPEGDAGTGMVATNSVAVRTGNVSAGTSIFSMVVLEKALQGVYTEIDMVTTPTGEPVAMVHCNNCTSDLNAWMDMFHEIIRLFGADADTDDFYAALYRKALEGDKDCGGLTSYNYYSGEPVTGLDEGRPLFVRTPDSRMNLANFMRSTLYSTFATLKIGMDILLEKEKVQIDNLMGHGGLFTTPGVCQSLLAAAVNSPVSVMSTASEGGAWGIAVLAAYRVCRAEGESLKDYLNNKVFAGDTGSRLEPKADDVAGFEAYMQQYRKALTVEKAAVQALR